LEDVPRDRVRLLTIVVIDDLVALVVIAAVYTDHVELVALAVAVGMFCLLLMLRYAPVDFGDELRYVWRHLPLSDVHLNAQMAAEATEAAAAQGAFWPMHDKLLAEQDELTATDLKRHAEELGLDVEGFWDELRRREHAERVAEDVASADTSGVAGTPSFFINGQRHQGAYDVETLSAAVADASQGESGLARAGARQLSGLPHGTSGTRNTVASMLRSS
jgi:hypothetical protein